MPKASPRTCTIQGCTRPHCAKGLCNTHYAAARRADPEVREKANRRARERYANDPEFTDAADVHHVVPVSKGGSSDKANLVAACPSCNRRLGNR